MHPERPSIAFLFGISRFTPSSNEEVEDITPVEHAASNVETLEELLAHEDVLGARIIPKVDPTRNEIITTLAQVRKVGEDFETAILYICSHGKPVGDKLHLFGSDTEAGFETETSINYEDIRDEFLRINARSRIILLDACYAALAEKLNAGAARKFFADQQDQTLRKIAEQNELDAHAPSNAAERPQGAFTMFSSKKGVMSDASNTSGTFTAFTGALIDAIKVGDTKKLDRKLTLDEIAKRTKTALVRSKHPTPTFKSINDFGGFPLIGNYQRIRSNAVDKALRDQLQVMQAENEDLRNKVVSLEEAHNIQATSSNTGEPSAVAKSNGRRQFELDGEILELIEASRDNPVTEEVEVALINWKWSLRISVISALLLLFGVGIDTFMFADQRVSALSFASASFPSAYDQLVLNVRGHVFGAAVVIFGFFLLLIAFAGAVRLRPPYSRDLYGLWQASDSQNFAARVRRLPIHSKTLLRMKRWQILGVMFPVRAIFYAAVLCIVGPVVSGLLHAVIATPGIGATP